MRIRFAKTPKPMASMEPINAATISQLPRLAIHTTHPIESCMKPDTEMDVYCVPSSIVEHARCDDTAYKCVVTNSTGEKLGPISPATDGLDVSSLDVVVSIVPMSDKIVRDVFVRGEAYRAPKGYRKNQQDCIDVISKAVMEFALADLDKQSK